MTWPACPGGTLVKKRQTPTAGAEREREKEEIKEGSLERERVISEEVIIRVMRETESRSMDR
jgi:hypothetical protein